MNKYGILEKEGEYRECHLCAHLCTCSNKGFVYSPKYIVQELYRLEINSVLIEEYKDLKEFNDLDEAKKYKRSLELKDGIVIE